MTAIDDRRLALVGVLVDAIAAEIGRLEPDRSIPWPPHPDVRAMVRHLGGVHRWVAAMVASGDRAAEPDPPSAIPDLGGWYRDGADALMATLATTAADAACWTLRGPGTASFWRRRMVFENVKHLMDLRASGGGHWTAAEELTPGDYADGIDELFAVFLPRSRPGLRPLPRAVVLEAGDTGDVWRIAEDWQVAHVAHAADEVRITGSAADLALTVWERADPLEQDGRFELAGDVRTIAAFRAAAVQPW